jgi:hypothetical protein
MKLNLKPSDLFLTLGFILALPILARAGVVYSDSFESNGDQTAPTPFTFTSNDSAGNASAQVINEVSGSYSFGYSGQNGNNDVVLHADGVPNGTATDVTLDLTNANVGSAYAAATTYTLTYLDAPTALAISTSLLGDGTVIGSTTETDAVNGSSVLASGTTVTFDTLTDPLLVGENIGIQSELAGSVGYDRYDAIDDYILTATSDIPLTPEPSTWALMFAGLLVLAGIGKFRSSSARA